MKKILLLAMLLAFSYAGQILAKSTYIPKYKNQITIKVAGEVTTKESTASFLTTELEGDDVSFSIVQQIVTKDLVKAIKSSKAAAGWSAVAAGLNAFSATLDRATNKSPYMTYRYADAVTGTNISLSNMYHALDVTDELTDLPISFVIQNKSGKELIVNDIDRGLMWFVEPQSTMTIPMDNGGEIHFRVSSTALTEPPIRYVTAKGTNEMEKYQNISYEDDSMWIMENIQSYDDPVAGVRTKSVGFEKIDKITTERTYYSPDEGKKLIKSLKK